MSYNLTQNSIIMIQALGHLHGQRIRNTFKYRYTGATELDGPTTLDALAEEFVTEVLTPLVAVQSNEMSWDGVLVQHLKPLRHRARYLAAPLPGDLNDPSLPSTTCVVLRRFAQQSGRRFQGRVFICGVPGGSVENSQLKNAVIAAWDAVATGLKEPLEGGTETEPFVPCIHVANPVSSIDDVDGTFCDPILRVQRRREIGVGE